MDYEKKYNEALENLRKVLNSIAKDEFDIPILTERHLAEIFPELIESEDEKIRKALIKILNEIVIGTNYKEFGIEYSIRDMVTWLEKQGEQKPSDKQAREIEVEHDVERLSPEPKESEDEKIRKELITHCRNTRCVTEEGAERIVKWIAWLEKQGEIGKPSYEIAEKEKREFVGDGFIRCYADFQDFKEGETYWLEYVGDDNYSVRSDNLLGKTYHITPCQLYTIFKKQTWLEKQSEPIDKEKVLIGARKDVALSIMDFLDNNSVGMCLSNMECEDLEDAVVNSKWTKLYNYMKKKLEKQCEANPYNGISFKYNGHTWGMCARDNGVEIIFDGELKAFLSSEKSFIYPIHPQPDLASKSEADNQNCVKPVDKVEPKFHKEEWIISDTANKDYRICKITDVKDGNYAIESIYGYKGYNQFNAFDNTYRLWDIIKDAKDGDVLYSLDSNQPFIYKERKLNEQATAYCGLNIYGKFFVWDTKDCVITLSNYIPATKEQRDTLMKAMADAGYTFDFEKKELKKIQCSSWSEEDECMLNHAIVAVSALDYYVYDDKQEIENWLKSLKERLKGE